MRHLVPALVLIVVGCGDAHHDNSGSGGNPAGSGTMGIGGAGGAGGAGGMGGDGGAGGTGGGAPVVTSMTIGSNGGTLVTPDGVVLVIPAGALAADTTISIARVTDNAPVDVVSDVFDLQPDGTEFAVPVELTIPYDPAKLGGNPPSDLAIASFNGAGFTGAGWTLIDGAPAKATAYITHFSPWAVVPSPPGNCTVNYGCMKQCAGVDVPDLCCNQSRTTCRSKLTTSFPAHVACYAKCIGTPKVTNFGNSDCMAGCCTNEGWTVKPQGTCYSASASQSEAQSVLDCARGCFGSPDSGTLCGGGPIQFEQCEWQENNEPSMSDECGAGVNSQILFTGLGTIADQIWGNPPAVHLVGGSFDASSMNVQLTCAGAVPGNGTMSGTWNGLQYMGTWTFGATNGTFTIGPGWPQD